MITMSFKNFKLCLTGYQYTLLFHFFGLKQISFFIEQEERGGRELEWNISVCVIVVQARDPTSSLPLHDQ